MRIKLIIFFFGVQLFSCLPPTEQENKLIKELNARYSEYEFEPFKDIKDIYVKMTLKNSSIDSLELKKVYGEIMIMNQDATGKPRTNWLYVLVYNSEGEYLFAMRQHEKKFQFLRNKPFNE